MPFNSLDFSALARGAAGGLLNSLLAGTGLAALAWLLSRVARRSHAGNRFAIWFVALIGISLLPWVGSVAVASSTTHPARASAAITLPESLAYNLFAFWMIGAALCLAHVAHGLYRLRRLRATCTPVCPQDLDPILREILAGNQPRRPVTLCVSNAVRVPAAIGYFRPRVVLPAWALAEIPPQEMNAILVHELAHLRRYDDWTNLAQELLRALFFFHPAVWFIESRLTLEREMACDDAVLAANFAPRAYAGSLVSLAEKSFLRRGVQLAQAAVGHVQQLKLRLAAILCNERIGQSRARLGKPAVALMSMVAIVFGYGVACSPGWITFSASHAPQVAQVLPQDALTASEVRLQPVNLALSSDAPSHNIFRKSAANPRHHLIQHIAPQPVRATVHRATVNPIAEGEAFPPPVYVSSVAPHLADYQVLVIFQGESLGPDGPVLWRVTVFRVSPVQQSTLSTSAPKKI